MEINEIAEMFQSNDDIRIKKIKELCKLMNRSTFDNIIGSLDYRPNSECQNLNILIDRINLGNKVSELQVKSVLDYLADYDLAISRQSNMYNITDIIGNKDLSLEKLVFKIIEI